MDLEMTIDDIFLTFCSKHRSWMLVGTNILTLKAPRKILEQTTIYFYFLFFKENNA